jgi:hypothetical protein
MYTALDRVPKDIKFERVSGIGNFTQLKKSFNTGGGRANGIYIRSNNAFTGQLQNQGIFWNTGKEYGKTLEAQADTWRRANETSVKRRGHEYIMSSDKFATAHHEVGHFVYYNKHGVGSERNKELRASWERTTRKYWSGPNIDDFPDTREGVREWQKARENFDKGEYARTNDEEAWAEAWSAYVQPSERGKLPKEIVQWIKEEVDQ